MFDDFDLIFKAAAKYEPKHACLHKIALTDGEFLPIWHG